MSERLIDWLLQVQKFQKTISKSINANIEAELMVKAQKAHEGKPFHTLGKVQVPYRPVPVRYIFQFICP